jgi:site-specific recombinase XerD
MLETYFPDPEGLQQAVTTEAGPYLEGFAQQLESNGYARATIHGHLRAAVHVALWQTGRGLSLKQFNEEELVAFRRHLGRCRCFGTHGAYHHHGAGARRFLGYLDAQSITIPMRSPAGELPSLLKGFRRWMRCHRGVTETTLEIYGRIVTDLLGALGEDTRQFDAHRLRAFVLDSAGHHGRSKAKLVVTSVRMFLRYLIAEGRCPSGLDGAIPTIADWRLDSLPRFLPASEVNRIIESCDPATSIGARDRAIVLLLARLGLRAGDILNLRIGDIDWGQATLQVSGKSRTLVRLPLPQEVGDAILNALTYRRLDSPDDYLFVRAAAPVGPFSKASAVSDIVKRAIRRAGVSAPSKGAHLLRHSAATQWLRDGMELEGIGVILRHRSIDTTAHYAKVDVERLRQLAQPWPEVWPC